MACSAHSGLNAEPWEDPDLQREPKCQESENQQNIRHASSFLIKVESINGGQIQNGSLDFRFANKTVPHNAPANVISAIVAPPPTWA